ncbi:hypothetical protein OY671_010632, partial [Metschnikowia pulcherrima]
CLRRRRLCQPAPGPPVDARFRRPQPVGGEVHRNGRQDRRGAGLHAGSRRRSVERAAAAGHQLLHQPRSAAAAVRTGDDAAGVADRRSVRHQRTHALDRRPRAVRRLRACRVPARRGQPDRHEVRAEPGARRAAAPARHAESGARGGPDHADQPFRARQGRSRPAGAGARGEAR